MITVPISLKDEDRHFLEEAVKSGRYLSESEVMAEALAALREREAIRRAELDQLHAEVNRGIEQADRGDFVEFTVEDVKREGRKRLAMRQAHINHAPFLFFSSSGPQKLAVSNSLERRPRKSIRNPQSPIRN